MICLDLVTLTIIILFIAEEKYIKITYLFSILFCLQGSLSAWFRSKYPYKVDGAVATSAPIYAQLDFKGLLFFIFISVIKFLPC